MNMLQRNLENVWSWRLIFDKVAWCSGAALIEHAHFYRWYAFFKINCWENVIQNLEEVERWKELKGWRKLLWKSIRMWKNVKEKAKGASRDSQQSCILPGSWLVAHGKLSIAFLQSSHYTVSVSFVRSHSSVSLSLSESMCTFNLLHEPHVEQNVSTSKKEDFVWLSWTRELDECPYHPLSTPFFQ